MKINLRKTENIEIGDVVTDGDNMYIICVSNFDEQVCLLDLKNSYFIETSLEPCELSDCIKEFNLKLVTKNKDVLITESR
ncbi:hypothetical protein [Peptostreptococcus equinus]|uniref:Uncharacterized protein n=1 Tax=Peptostreptococcus equinus TaxID=3003601 RepID=A0ABY7JPG3_9FIRM|nr:hypothetical protein [Peptostreptococcus sp. CBA3647]WAW14636.1 hypothetical protein O0R46_08535 [Peptostreptococcus sp. CBA3647]WAW15253.1 hypothetical protein O0R46_02040 [Peptostreptococcus sp. CBA3647]